MTKPKELYHIPIHLRPHRDMATLAPFAWLFISSIFYQRDLTTVPFNLFPKEITFSRYIDIFTNPNNATAYTFKISMLNSLVVASIGDNYCPFRRFIGIIRLCQAAVPLAQSTIIFVSFHLYDAPGGDRHPFICWFLTNAID